ncbi:MAG TPA: cation diffusion facilitator family transporter [Bacteroidales bacterium]|jgi:cation diffusion facilitator family transporter|nr:cation diffusion facilitator family transporter [Bacteroidales bacterium]
MYTKKVKTARLSIISNSFLIVLKVVAGIISGSVSIISEAIHSGMDLIAAVIAFVSVKYSDAPPDAGHPYGHGKFENVSGVIEAVLIFIAAGWIIYEAIHKIIHPVAIEKIGTGSIIMAISAGVNYIVSRKLYKVAKETDSIALEADALHLKMDVLTSAAVAVGLLLIGITGWAFLDPVVAILVALLILKESYVLMISAFSPLIDHSLSEEENKIIREEIVKRNLSFHNLRTRKSGQFRFADLHLELPENMSLKDVHRICDEIENEIENRIAHMSINIHVEPGDTKENVER